MEIELVLLFCLIVVLPIVILIVLVISYIVMIVQDKRINKDTDISEWDEQLLEARIKLAEIHEKYHPGEPYVRNYVSEFDNPNRTKPIPLVSVGGRSYYNDGNLSIVNGVGYVTKNGYRVRAPEFYEW